MSRGSGWKRGTTRKGKRQELEPQVFSYRPIVDEQGNAYLPYCAYRWHQGFIRKTAQTCLARECKYLRRIYLKDLPGALEISGLACIAENF